MMCGGRLPSGHAIRRSVTVWLIILSFNYQLRSVTDIVVHLYGVNEYYCQVVTARIISESYGRCHLSFVTAYYCTALAFYCRDVWGFIIVEFRSWNVCTVWSNISLWARTYFIYAGRLVKIYPSLLLLCSISCYQEVTHFAEPFLLDFLRD